MKWTNNRINKQKEKHIRIVRKFCWLPRKWGTSTVWLETVPVVERMMGNPDTEGFSWKELDTLGDFLNTLDKVLKDWSQEYLENDYYERSILFFKRIKTEIPNFFEYFYLPAPITCPSEIKVMISCAGSSYTPMGFRELLKNSIEGLSFISDFDVKSTIKPE